MELYDIAIIGGGPAGYHAAEYASEAGLSTLLIEKNKVGGVCLNEGCIPTKTFLYSSKTYQSVLHGDEKGIGCSKASINHSEVLARKNKIVKTLVRGVESALKRKKVDVKYGQAAVSGSPGSFNIAVENDTYQARHILVATGSVPILPPIPGMQEGIDNGTVLTSRELLDIKNIPSSLVIVGAGVIGLEMAEYFNSAGSSVTIFEMLDKIGGEIETDAAGALQDELAKKGISFHLKSKVISVSGGKATFEKDGKEQSVAYDKLLLSVGRKASLDGLEALGLYTERGALVTDERCATNIAGVYAAGDVNGRYMLAHVAYREAEVAINNIAGLADAVDYSAVPSVIYTDPEIACAGISEQKALTEGRSISVRNVSVNMSGRHVAERGLGNGFCKLIIDKKLDIIIGATLVCTYASEIIYALSLMIQNKIPIDSIKKTIFPHPTVCEIIKEAVFSK